MFIKRQEKSKDSVFTQYEIEDALRVLDDDEKFNNYLDKKIGKDKKKQPTNKKIEALFSEKELVAYFLAWSERRNRQIRTYLSEKNGMPESAFSDKLAPIEELKNTVGKPYFDVQLDLN